MSAKSSGGGVSRPGFRTLTASLLLAAALWALQALDSQIQVFSFGESGPDARSFPRGVLWLLVAVVALRLVLSLRREDAALRAGPLLRVLAVVAVCILALWSMPTVGFLAGAAGAGVIVSLVLGERKPLMLGLPLLVSAVVAYGGQHGLNIPLP
ncbi:tripartite tricarboxylate transporter TctB family protein [Oceanicola sp. S124]|uniref:tripartite tricarboxylate transporter TctB family protein n=1 Tax=Oceanicola sp. S124 TaxID=1042378 RepID=UPI00058F1FCE|nr:tripartite tricarboxylate transporter TctB family protein [Oceanicola sp. S124]